MSYVLSFDRKKIVIVRRFVGWLERSGEMSVNARSSKEASRWTETSVQFQRAIVDCVCFVGTVLVEFRPALNLQRRKCFAKKLIMGIGLKRPIGASVLC
ncbi:hypothetical protein AVEN_136646-1 [Araneus ventricosus]|uniref:Uncharacterized protein n=1 Tax=Araneus ventricosus TaxID=182803 RepID=A0A4Y2CBI4_ARAVE|nr:hypothetical protein AVEN_136646-1 [Araneus ventricosus]